MAHRVNAGTASLGPLSVAKPASSIPDEIGHLGDKLHLLFVLSHWPSTPQILLHVRSALHSRRRIFSITAASPASAMATT
jgi:hypothetical protein